MNQQLTRYFIDNLKKFSNKSFRDGKADQLQLLNVFIRHFISTFMADDFRPDRADLLGFIEHNEVIANLMEVAELGTTEPQLTTLLPNSADDTVLLKMMALYSARNTLELSPDIFFERDAEAASLWYCVCIGNVDWAGVSAPSLARIRRLSHQIDHRLQYVAAFTSPYFTCTYVDETSVAPIRRRIHHIMRNLAPSLPIVGHVSGKRIAIVTDRWRSGNVIHRALAPFIHALATEFDLSLVHLSDDEAGLDLQGINDVQCYCFHRERPEEVLALAGRFDMLLFTDIGMGIESIYLASLRLAPVQVMLCGHPESSWSPAIDYFIHGADVIDPTLASSQFGEKLVLIPGCGHLSTRPPYDWRRLLPPTNELRIACCWSPQKIHPEHLQHLAAAAIDAGRPIKFLFLGLTGTSLQPLLRTLQKILGPDRVETAAGLDYADYMAKLESCHFGVDSWPFGGYHTVVDLLWVRKPVVALQGNRSFNRNAGFFQSQLGLADMITHTPEAFIALLRRMIVDDRWRELKTDMLQQADVERVLLSREPVASFVAAIHMLLTNHPQLQATGSHEPLRVTA